MNIIMIAAPFGSVMHEDVCMNISVIMMSHFRAAQYMHHVMLQALHHGSSIKPAQIVMLSTKMHCLIIINRKTRNAIIC